MKKIGALLFLITSITCFSQTIQNSPNKLHQKLEIEDGKDGKTSISLLFDIDSVYVSEYDSLELDYMYPGIFSQNEKTLNNIFCNDLRKKGSLYEALYKQGFISTNVMDIPLRGKYNQNPIYRQLSGMINDF